VKYRSFRALVLTICLSIVAQVQAQTSTASSVSVEHPWARATAGGAKTAVVYVTLINRRETADRLIGASTPVAEKVQFHQEIDDKGIMRMRQQAAVDIGPGGTFTFKPGGAHMMMVGLRQPLKEGQTFSLTLEFEKGGKVEVQVPIAKPGAMGDHNMRGM